MTVNTPRRRAWSGLFLVVGLLLAACSGATASPTVAIPAPPAAAPTATAAPIAVAAPTTVAPPTLAATVPVASTAPTAMVTPAVTPASTALAPTATVAPTRPPATTSPLPTAAPVTVAASPTAVAARCQPTQPDQLGPFYVPGAPIRASVGAGYRLTGVVQAAGSCRPLPGARVEFWLANPRGDYDDAHRATVMAGDGGAYRFESNSPPPYAGRPPHIHLRVSAPGYSVLVTQHYPSAGATEAVFDLVLTAA